MALSLKGGAETEVAKLTGESLSEAVRKALGERLERERCNRGQTKGVAKRLNEIAKERAALPDYDIRSPEEIIGCDEYGVLR